MAFPTGWPPGTPSNRNTLRFYHTGTATGNFNDNAFLFGNYINTSPITGNANPGYSYALRITVSGGDVEISFDGTNVHGKITAAQIESHYYHRQEGGIAIRGSGTYTIEAW